MIRNHIEMSTANAIVVCPCASVAKLAGLEIVATLVSPEDLVVRKVSTKVKAGGTNPTNGALITTTHLVELQQQLLTRQTFKKTYIARNNRCVFRSNIAYMKVVYI